MQLSNRRGEIALLGQELGPRPHAGLGEVGAKPHAVVGHAVRKRMAAGEERRPRRHADGRRRIRPVVAKTCVGDAVDMRRLYEVGTVTTQEVVPELVGHEEEEVRSVGACHGRRFDPSEGGGVTRTDASTCRR